MQFCRGLKSDLPESALDGQPLLTEDTHELFVGRGIGSSIVPVQISYNNILNVPSFTTLATPPLSIPALDGSSSYTLDMTLLYPNCSFYYVNGLKRVYGEYYTIRGNTLYILDAYKPDASQGDSHELYGV